MLAAWCFRPCDLRRACALSCNHLSWQYVGAGVPVRSFVVALRGPVPERCWIYTSLRVLLQLVSIELEIAYPGFLVLQRFVVLLLRILDIVLVPLRRPPWISSLRLHC